MINLKIDPEFQNQIPPLTDDEYKQLEENILKEGKLISPLIVWNNTLVDGHNRYAILQKHPEIYFSTQWLLRGSQIGAAWWKNKSQDASGEWHNDCGRQQGCCSKRSKERAACLP